MASGQQWIETWFNSPYYPILYHHRDELEASVFVERLVHHLQIPPDALMLDVASGTGRHARQLAERGFEVTGIDLSSRSIQLSTAHESDKLSFYQHDMRGYFRINYFDYVFNFFTSFGYFELARENEDALRTMSMALKPGGTLVLDYLNSEYVKDHLVENEVKVIRGVQFVILRSISEDRFIKKIDVYDSSRLVREQHEERVMAYTKTDFEEMFSRHQLQITESFGDYDLHPFNSDSSPRLILIATRQP